MFYQVLLYMVELLDVGYLFCFLFVIPRISFIGCPWLHPLRTRNNHSLQVVTSSYCSVPHTLKASVASHTCISGDCCHNLLFFVC